MYKRLANQVIKQLKTEGIKVMRYDAYSSNSIYLKMDDGVLGTIRISDHRGKKHLPYKWNLIRGDKCRTEHQGRLERHYFSFREVDRMVTDILEDRDILVLKYGLNRYQDFMKQNKCQTPSYGFWAKAKYV